MANTIPGALVGFWIAGLAVTTPCILIQIAIYCLVRDSRKASSKILTLLTVTRLLNSAFELTVTLASLPEAILRDFVHAAYIQSDSILIFWMFLFSKHLYDKVINALETKKVNLVLVSCAVFVLTLPIGIACSVILHSYLDYFDHCYKAYAAVKFVILFVNLWLFIRIFRVLLRLKTDKNIRGMIKTCAVSILLLSVTCLQVFVSDLMSLVYDYDPRIPLAFCVISSFQAVPITVIFVILVNGTREESLYATFRRRFVKVT